MGGTKMEDVKEVKTNLSRVVRGVQTKKQKIRKEKQHRGEFDSILSFKMAPLKTT